MNIRVKTSLSITAFIIVVLFTLTYIHLRNEEKEHKDDLLSEGMTFAELTSTRISSDYEKYYHNAFYTFLSYIKKLYETNENLYKIEIADVSGNILLGLEEIEISSPVSKPRRITPSIL